MKKYLLVLLLIFSILVSATACGEYNPPMDDTDNSTSDGTQDDNGNEEQNPPENNTGTPFVATVMLNGKPFVPNGAGDSDALKVRWTDGKSYHTVNVGEDGSATCYGLDGDYSVTLLNLPTGYTYNPNIYTASSENPNVIIDLLSISSGRGNGTELYSCIELSNPGVYRANIKTEGQVVYFQFTPTKAGIYVIESLMDVSAQMYNPIADVYSGSAHFKVYDEKLDGGGASSGYTKNFKKTIQIAQSFIGNSYTYGVWVEGKDAVYPVNVDFAITYLGGYTYDGIVSSIMIPEFIPNFLNKQGTTDTAKFNSWLEDYRLYLSQDRALFGDSEYYDAAVIIDGKRVFDQDYYKLNPNDGYYHVYDAEKYAATGGWGPILYANISIPTKFIDAAFNTIEYAGNKNLTLAGGTENYKMFIEGYANMIHSDSSRTPYFCVSDCPCYPDNGGCCPVEDNCSKCSSGCRHIPRANMYQKGYADIAINGRCPVTEELKDFLQKYSVSQKLFSDGNGWAESYVPRYDAYEDSQWLFACGYYSD